MKNLLALALLASFNFASPALAETSENAAEFLIKAPDGNILNLSAVPGSGKRTDGVGELLDGTSVFNLGCKATTGTRWCLIQAERTREFGWVDAVFLEKAAPFEIKAGTGEPVAEEKMPDICRTEVAKGFTVRPETIELLPIKPEAGGVSITGTAIATDEEAHLVPFQYLFDKESRFSDTIPLISDGE